MRLTSYDFACEAKKAIAAYTNENRDIEEHPIDWTDVHVVWQCKTLQHHKGIFITLLPNLKLFEATYNGDKGEMYLDAYNKERNWVEKLPKDE